MTAQYALVPVEDLARLADTVERLEKKLEGCTITPAPEWLSIANAARALGVTPSTVHRRIASGSLEARNSGKLRQVKVDQSSRVASSSADAS